jgi:hypothetical protein
MRLILKICLCLVAGALAGGVALAASFTASLDRDAITLGEQATLSLKFDGVQPQDAPGIPGVAGLQFQYVGPSSSFSFINGQTSSSITYNYLVLAQRDGEFTIPAMRADVNGQQLVSAPLKLIVSKAAAPTAAAVNSGSEVAFLKLVLSKPRLYVGESTVAHLDLYLRDDVQNFGNFQLTSSATDGFSAGKITELPNQRRRAQVGNHVYTIIPLSMPLTVVRNGKLTLGPFTAGVVVVLPSHDRGNPFFMFNQGEQQQLTLASEPVEVEALSLPATDRPANFTGAVGSFTLNATAGPTTVTVGDPITVRVQISGRGALDGVTLPTQDAWQNFKTYPPTTKLETTDQFGFQGTKTFEQIISPLNNDVHEIPPLNFSYFDPNDGQYHALAQPATPLTVRAASATPLPQIAATKAEEKPAQDILPIKENIGTLSPNKIPFVAQPAFLAAQTVPVLAFLAAFIWRKRADSLANNPRLRRQRAVAALIAAGKSDLKKFAAENKPDEFFATLFRLLQEQLGERLDCPATAITENVIDEHTVLRGMPTATRDGLRELFQLCNQARYAPVRGSAELNSVAARFEKTVSELQEVKV